MNLALLVFTSRQDIGVHYIRLISAILSVLVTPIMGYISALSHFKEQRTSFLLNAYLLVALSLGAVRTRTAWLIFGPEAYTILFATGLGLTAIIAVLEAIPKSSSRTVGLRDRSPEETSGLYSLIFMSWLLPLIRLGSKTILDTDDLYLLDSSLSADRLSGKFEKSWEETKGATRMKLGWALWKSVCWDFLLPVPSRVAFLIFTLCQPSFINGLVSYLDQDHSSDNATGLGLIIASIVIYGGIAVTSSSFYYFYRRALTNVNGSLVTAIFQRTVELHSAQLDTSVLTLMSTDVQRISSGMEPLHDVWANMVEISFAGYFLYQHIGLAFIAPFAVVTISVLGTALIGGAIGNKMSRWAQRTESRVKLTSAVVSNMKPLRISGLADTVTNMVQGFRENELRAGATFRLFITCSIVNAFIPQFLAPVAAFYFTDRSLSMAEVFTSLSYLWIITGPLSQLFQRIPAIISSLTSLNRVQEFLNKSPRVDYRVFDECSVSDSQGRDVAISLENVEAGWTEGRWQLTDLNTDIPKSQLTIITGPVASGKSTFCKALLGEALFSEGTLTFHKQRPVIAYCDQTAFLVNGSIRSNIIGFKPFDRILYDEILDAVLLKSDLRSLPRSDDTPIGSEGVTLSGGQRQRVALARALYLQADVYVLDDFTVGLDRPTADEIVRRLFKQDGLLQRREATVVWCTHSTWFLPLAQHVIALGIEGRILSQGPPDEVIKDRQVTLAMESTEDADENGVQDTKDNVSDTESPTSSQSKSDRDPSRALNGVAVYIHYFSSFSPTLLFFYVLFLLIFGTFLNFGSVWLNCWADNSFNIPGPPSHIRMFYFSIYTASQAIGLISLGVYNSIVTIGMAFVSGSVLHIRALQSLMGAPLHYLTKTDQGVIVNIFSQDMNLIDTLLPVMLMNTFAVFLWVVGQAVIIIMATPFIGLLYPIVVIVSYLISKLYLRTTRQLRLLELENKSPLYSQFRDTVRGISSIRAFGWVSEYTAQNHLYLDDSQRPFYLLEMCIIWLELVMKLISAIIAVFVTVLATRVASTSSRAGLVGASFVGLMLFGELLNAVIQGFVQLETSLGAVKRLMEFGKTTGSEDRVGEDFRPNTNWPEKGEIVLDGVDASYQEEKYRDDAAAAAEETSLALKGISMTIRPGEKVALVGRTGSGKSSMILLLLRLLDPTTATENNITIDKLPLRRIHRNTLRQRVIAIPQDMIFLAAGETFRAMLDPHSRVTDKDCLAALEDVGLLGTVKESGGLQAEIGKETLSHGQKQLFSLAIAILRARAREQEGSSSGILLLDEITSNVDRETEIIIMQVIERVFKNYTVVAVTHSLESVVGFDRVFVMAEGQVIKDGTPNTLIKEQESST